MGRHWEVQGSSIFWIENPLVLRFEVTALVFFFVEQVLILCRPFADVGWFGSDFAGQSHSVRIEVLWLSRGCLGLGHRH